MTIKRSDNNYQEIEEFADYELTQCVAFEMAIRNVEVKAVIKKSRRVSSTYSKDDRLQEASNFIDSIMVHKDDKEKKEYPIKLAEYGFDYIELMKYLHITEEKQNLILLELSNFKLKDILTDDELSIVCTLERALWNSIKYTNIETDIIDTNEEFLEKYLTSFDWVFSEFSDVIIKEALKRSQKTKINYNTSRPSIKPIGYQIHDIEINLNFPKYELLSYISKLKDEFDDDNSNPKSLLELLGEFSNKSDIKISKKKLADKFFVYDYIQARLEEIEVLNTESKETFNEKVMEIENNLHLNDTYKTKQINILKEELQESIVSTPINDILEEEELTISKGTAKRYYYEMKPYIEEEKYKELITGIRT